jgi:mono/diheme cytochrome c family protein
MIKGTLVGVLLALAAGAGAGYLFLSLGLMPANADANPPKLERWIERTALDAALRRGAPKGPNPVALSDASLLEGVRLYAANCAVCHGAAGAEPSNVASGLYQEAPQLAKFGVEDDDEGETYWKIAHGMRMTAMPGFRGSLSEHEIWTLALFLKNMDSLSPAAEKAWKAVPSSRHTGPQ